MFYEDYELLSLEEVETHIKKNGHLLNIPSAKEIEEKGLDLGEMNKLYYGLIGAGSLMTGDAVSFVRDMKNPLGTAKIKDYTLYRFNYQLSINNVVFKESAKVDFTARNRINLFNTHLKPDEDGFIHLKVDTNVDICSPNPWDRFKSSTEQKSNTVENKQSLLYPNPNNGMFSILIQDLLYDDISFEIYDINGRVIYKESFNYKTHNNNIFEFNLPDLL